MTARKKPVDIWDAEFEHWHVLGPVLWGVLAYVGAGLLYEFQVPILYVVLTGAGTSLLAPLVAVYKRFAFLLMLAVTGLLTWTTITTPWQRTPVTVAVAGTALFGMTYHALRNREAKAADADKASKLAAKKGRYVDLLESIDCKGLEEVSRSVFEAGKTLVLLLPPKGLTLARLKDHTEALTIAAARAGLRGVTFEFEQSPDSPAEVLLHVFDRDILAEDVPLPFERGPKSISEPIPLGKFPTGEVCVVTFREVAALLVGLKGKGKSGLIHTHLAHLTGCTDAVVWLLDGKGGETVQPWIQPFLDMVTDKPAINWVASTEKEFDAVLLAARAVVRFRTTSAKRTGKRWPSVPTAAAPAVIVIVEEASVITGVARYGSGNRVEMAQDGVTLGRSSGVDWLFATQRATLDMLGSGSMKSNLDLRYGMGVKEEQDARMIFPDGRMAKSLYRLGDANKYRGTFLMQAPGVSRVMPAKGYWIHPDTIPGIATSNAQWTAELDQETADHVHQVLLDAGVPGGYYGRWDRLAGRVSAPVQDTPAVPSQRPADTASQPETGRAMSAVQDAIAASRAKRDDDTFRALVAQFETMEIDEDDIRLRDVSQIPAGVPPILGMVLSIFRARNETGLPSKLIADELNVSQKTLGRFMGHCNVSGQEVIWDGKRARGYTRDAVETSVKRGSWTQGAFDWQP